MRALPPRRNPRRADGRRENRSRADPRRREGEHEVVGTGQGDPERGLFHRTVRGAEISAARQMLPNVVRRRNSCRQVAVRMKSLQTTRFPIITGNHGGTTSSQTANSRLAPAPRRNTRPNGRPPRRPTPRPGKRWPVLRTASRCSPTNWAAPAETSRRGTGSHRSQADEISAQKRAPARRAEPARRKRSPPSLPTFPMTRRKTIWRKTSPTGIARRRHPQQKHRLATFAARRRSRETVRASQTQASRHDGPPARPDGV